MPGLVIPEKQGGTARHGGRAADAVVERLAMRIASGALPDGSTLPAERALMAEFGASRTVIREAITALSSQGLIENRPRFRPVVKKPGFDSALAALGGIVGHLLTEPEGVKALFDSRIFLERALVREAAMHARRGDIQALREALAANAAAIPDSARFYATDVAFHAVFYEIPRNPILPAIHRAYVAWLAGHWDRMLRSPERNQVNYQSHRAILDAVVERDPDAAEAALASHLNAAWEYVRVTFEPNAQEEKPR